MHVNMQMTTLALSALITSTALAHPFSHKHMHDLMRRAEPDWSKVDYSGVDWSKVFGKPAAAPAASAASPQQQPAAAAPPATQQKLQTKPKTEQKNTATGGSGGTYKGPKRGLAFNPESPSLNAFSGVGNLLSGWSYNWVSAPSQPLPAGLSFVPMLHDLTGTFTSVWRKEADAWISKAGGQTTYLMGFNEPDIPTQAHIAVPEAVQGWHTYMQPYAGRGNVKLGSPSVSNSQDPGKGLQWLSSFLSLCGDCQIDYVPVHWYGCPSGCALDAEIKAFKDFVGQAEKAAGGRPIWITEFQTLSADQESFVKSVVPWLDGQAGVERYAYFMAKDGILTQGNGASALGKAYGTAS